MTPEPPAQPAYIPGISAPPMSRTTGVLVRVAAACVIAATGLYFFSWTQGLREDRAAESAYTAVVKRQAEDERFLNAAIRERKVLFGMTRGEVRMAKGAPEDVWKDGRLPQSFRNAGGVELWLWDHPHPNGRIDVLFGAEGLVIAATELRGQPRSAMSIRR